MEYVQGKELKEFMESQSNKMKTNIKMKVTPEQSKKVQEICFNNKFGWITSGYKIVPTEYIFIGRKDIRLTRDNEFFDEYNFVETDADLFIRTNGTCEEDIYERVNQHQVLNNVEIKELKDDVAILEQKLKKKNEILKKARIKRKNQREELHKLNLKLQKCISLEEHRKAINWHIERNEALFAEIDNLKAENIEMGKLVNLNKSALDLAVMTKDLAMKTVKEQNKEIEKLKAVIEYLESKVK